MSNILETSDAFTPRCSYAGCFKGVPQAMGVAPMQICDFSVIASWLSLDLRVGVGDLLRVCRVPLGHLFVGLLLGDCFCKIISCHYCSFYMYYFSVVLALFYVMRNSPNCDVFFYCIIILKATCLIL